MSANQRKSASTIPPSSPPSKRGGLSRVEILVLGSLLTILAALGVNFWLTFDKIEKTENACYEALGMSQSTNDVCQRALEDERQVAVHLDELTAHLNATEVRSSMMAGCNHLHANGSITMDDHNECIQGVHLVHRLVNRYHNTTELVEQMLNRGVPHIVSVDPNSFVRRNGTTPTNETDGTGSSGRRLNSLCSDGGGTTTCLKINLLRIYNSVSDQATSGERTSHCRETDDSCDDDADTYGRFQVGSGPDRSTAIADNKPCFDQRTCTWSHNGGLVDFGNVDFRSTLYMQFYDDDWLSADDMLIPNQYEHDTDTWIEVHFLNRSYWPKPGQDFELEIADMDRWTFSGATPIIKMQFMYDAYYDSQQAPPQNTGLGCIFGIVKAGMSCGPAIAEEGADLQADVACGKGAYAAYTGCKGAESPW
eukprot:g5176.t1